MKTARVKITRPDGSVTIEEWEVAERDGVQYFVPTSAYTPTGQEDIELFVISADPTDKRNVEPTQ